MSLYDANPVTVESLCLKVKTLETELAVVMVLIDSLMADYRARLSPPPDQEHVEPIAETRAPNGV